MQLGHSEDKPTAPRTKTGLAIYLTCILVILLFAASNMMVLNSASRVADAVRLTDERRLLENEFSRQIDIVARDQSQISHWNATLIALEGEVDREFVREEIAGWLWGDFDILTTAVIGEASMSNLVQYYSGKGVSGFILAATTGEGQLLTDEEMVVLVETAAETLASAGAKVPLYLGLSGSDPVKVIAQLNAMNQLPLEGYLVSGPNYLRPSQEGVKRFYLDIANSTDRNILIYNIPYRTGVNIQNETMLELAAVENIVGVKDCCGDAEQSYALLRLSPPGFSVLTGEDPFIFSALAHNAPGAIVTGAHILVEEHLKMLKFFNDGNHDSALRLWNNVTHIPRLLFSEPNPAPLKYWLWRQGLINTPEIRLPFLPIGRDLSARIDRCMAESDYLAD